MARHRRHKFSRKIISVAISSAIIGSLGWVAFGGWDRFAGWVLLCLFSIPFYLFISLTIGCLAPALVTDLLIPRRWRIKYRQRHGRAGAKSSYIPQKLRDAVYFADHHRCISCGTRSDLQIDHMIPWAGGGITSILNCFTLCGIENLIKSNYSVDKDGYVHYRGFIGELTQISTDDKLRWAAHILMLEKRKRWNAMRWLRLAWAMI